MVGTASCDQTPSAGTPLENKASGGDRHLNKKKKSPPTAFFFLFLLKKNEGEKKKAGAFVPLYFGSTLSHKYSLKRSL